MQVLHFPKLGGFSVCCNNLTHDIVHKAGRRVLLAAGKLGGIVAVWRSQPLKEGALPKEPLAGATLCRLHSAWTERRHGGPEALHVFTLDQHATY